MIGISFEIISGLTVGMEHDSGNDEDEYNWLVAIHLGIFRILFISFKQA